MTFSSIVRKNFTHNFNKYISFYFVNSLIIAMLFMYGSLIFNPAILEDIGKTSLHDTVNIALLGVIIFSIVFITYTNTSFLKNRGKEFGVYLTLGMTTKDLTKLIFVENLGIMVASLVTGILSGALFGRLFYMGLNEILTDISIPYELNYKSFLLSGGIFVLIFICNFIFNAIYIRKVSIIDAIKADKKKEVGKSNVLLGAISLVLLIIALYCLPKTLLKEIFKEQPFMIGVFVVIIMSCPYLIMGSFIAIVKEVFSKFPKIYNKNLLVLSNLSHRFLGYKNILYILSLLVAGAMFFVGYSYSIYASTREYVTNDNPFEIMFVESDKYNKVDKENLEEAINKANGEIENYDVLEYMEVPVFGEKGDVLSFWNGAEAVISESNYNKHMESNLDIKTNEALYITVFNERLEYEHPTAILTNLTEEKRDEVRASEDHNYTLSREVLDSIIGEAFSWEIKESNIKEEKNVKFTNYRHGGEYSSGTALIIDDKDYEVLKNNFAEKSVKKLHLMNVKNKDVAFNELIGYLKKVNNLDNSYWNEGNLFGGKITDDERGTIEAYRPIYREELIKMQFDNNGITLFTMIFIGLLFVIANGVVLYYKVFNDIKDEKERIISLDRIGILQSEVRTIISKELSITFFAPIIVGGSLGMYFLYVIVSNSGMTELLIRKSVIVLLIGTVIQIVLYLISRRKYIREVTCR
ncbi:ABC transporter permease [Clostridium sp. UBA6640]|uniref:ABC transporter permease n=1 Tax=Clostridium sp. UBA6640 TaxID=1946370 RepID=UPI0025B7B2B5|nr:ABC transporter permease [Clostridium sp. UBA6640]